MERKIASLENALEEVKNQRKKAEELYQAVRKEKNYKQKKINRLMQRLDNNNNNNKNNNNAEEEVLKACWELHRSSSWRRLNSAAEKLEDAAELVAGTTLQQDLYDILQEEVHKYVEQEDERSQEVQESEPTTSNQTPSNKERLRCLMALRARLKHHISQDGYYSLSSGQ